MKKIYDLENRTEKFAKNVLSLIKLLKTDLVNTSIISQLARSSLSIGANYCEADNAESKRDFKHKIGIVKKECKETKFLLKMLFFSTDGSDHRIEALIKEANELTLIFNSIFNKL